MRVLHLTPHLGGGVGKALASLIGRAARSGEFEHAVVSLCRPEKGQFLERIAAAGAEVAVAPGPADLRRLAERADLIQLEWWNHPETIRTLCETPLPPLRLVTWCHVSGLHNPRIPAGLVAASHKLVLTSACSLEAPELRAAPAGRLAVVSSGGGLADLPPPRGHLAAPPRVGYVGSLNFAKLHPRFVDHLAAVPDPEFRVDLIGDLTNREALEAQCRAAGRPGLLRFRGYTTEVAAELASIDLLAYLLDPHHYGTAENALLEAMAMGIVPIVLDNPAERRIVDHGLTGLVVEGPEGFAAAYARLVAEPAETLAMSRRAAAAVRERYTSERMERGLNAVYREVLAQPPRPLEARAIFGDDPASWFLASQPPATPFRADGGLALAAGETPPPVLLERTKGSVFHFRDHFPGDPRLQRWATTLEGFR